MAQIDIRRVYDREQTTGATFLVDRMWPRGIRKTELERDYWLRDVAPSTPLRRWFGHRPERFGEFRARYWQELDSAPDAVAPILDAARRGPVTLLYAAKDDQHNNAVVLKEYVEDRLQRE